MFQPIRSAGIALSVAMSLTARAAWAGLDQDQSNLGGPGGGYYQVGGDQLVAQTFTAGVSGQISRVSVHVRADHVVPVLVEIRSTVNDVALVFGGNFGQTTTLVPSSTVLAATLVNTTSAPFPQSFGWVNVDFSLPAQVTGGTRYALLLRLQGTPPAGLEANVQWTLARGANGTDLYPPGQSFALVNGIGYWSVDDLVQPGLTTHEDTLFQTFVSQSSAVPALPGWGVAAQFLLMLLCGAAATVRLRSRPWNGIPSQGEGPQ